MRDYLKLSHSGGGDAVGERERPGNRSARVYFPDIIGLPKEALQLTELDFHRFTCLLNNLSLYPYQVRFGWAVIKNVLEQKGSELIGFFARKSGKTETIANVAVFLGVVIPTFYSKAFPEFEKGIGIGIFGPKERQARITFMRIKDRFNSEIIKNVLGISYTISNQEMFRLSNGITIICSTGSDKTTLEGETLNLAILEEAQDMTDLRIKKTIYPMCAAHNGTRVLLGTSTPEHIGYFYHAIKRAKNTSRLYQVDWEEAAKYSKPYKRYVEEFREEVGEDDDSFQTQFGLRWVDTKSKFITLEEIKELRGDFNRKVFEKEMPCYAGIDVAKTDDRTVVTIVRSDSVILNWLETSGDYGKQRLEIKDFLANYNIFFGYIDIMGPGDPFLTMLQEEGVENIIGFLPNPKNKSDAYRELLMAFKRKKIRYPYADKSKEMRHFEEQFTNLEKRYYNQYLLCSKPKNSSTAKDDYCDSLAYAYWALASTTKDLSLEIDIGKKGVSESDANIIRESSELFETVEIYDTWGNLKKRGAVF